MLMAYWKDNFAEVILEKDEKGYLKMYINGGLQFDEKDEYRYHQTLFLLPALCLDGNKANNVLVLGGGDGLGVRELLRVPHIDSIDLVDISDFITTLSKTHPEMLRINFGSLNHPKVNVIIGDGYEYVKNTDKKYDLIILDYPDPSINENDLVNKLFTKQHYSDVARILKEDGIIALQSTSVKISPNVFRYLQLQIKDVLESYLPLRIDIHSFGDIGIIIGKKEGDIYLQNEIPEGVFFNENSLTEFALFHTDELPDISDEELKNLKLWEVVQYDILIRRKELEEEIKEIYRKQINGN